MSKTLIIVNIIFLAASIVGIAGSAYGIGREERDKTSPAYQTASVFLGVSVVLNMIFVLSLLAMILFSTGGATLDIGRGGVSFGNYRPMV